MEGQEEEKEEKKSNFQKHRVKLVLKKPCTHMSLSGSKVLMMNWEYGSMKSKYNLMGLIFCANKKH